METIFALASGAVPSGVAVVRLSGPGVRFGLDTIVGKPLESRRLTLCDMRSADGSLLDRGLVVLFPAPSSFTGEDVAEFHLHGGPAVVAAMLDRLGGLDGYRMAEAGEFTRRAFLNGRLDLLQVEGLADLIAAETEGQRRQALRQTGGAMSDVYDRWRAALIAARARLEAELDFVDEDDVPDDASAPIWDDLARLRQDIVNHIDNPSGERIRTGLEIVVAGPPNAGKSSLVNALARRDVAIVADEAGTTRDLIEVRLDLDGIPVTLVDTAGLREAGHGDIEAEGMRRARARAESADLVLWLRDLTDIDSDPDRIPENALLVGTKVDLLQHGTGTPKPDDRPALPHTHLDATVSVQSRDGLDELLKVLTARARELAGATETAVVTRERHRLGLRSCADEIRQAMDQAEAPLEIRAEALRRASDALGAITGTISVEDLLDVIFADFCVGK